MKNMKILAIIGIIAILWWLGLVPALLDAVIQLLDRVKSFAS